MVVSAGVLRRTQLDLWIETVEGQNKFLSGRFIKRKLRCLNYIPALIILIIIGEQLLYFSTKCLLMLLKEAKPWAEWASVHHLVWLRRVNFLHSSWYHFGGSYFYQNLTFLFGKVVIKFIYLLQRDLM